MKIFLYLYVNIDDFLAKEAVKTPPIISRQTVHLKTKIRICSCFPLLFKNLLAPSAIPRNTETGRAIGTCRGI